MLSRCSVTPVWSWQAVLVAVLCTAAGAEARSPPELTPCATLRLPSGFRGLAKAEHKSFEYVDSPAGGGGTRCGRVVVAKAGTTLFRYHGGPATEFGGFWALRAFPTTLAMVGDAFPRMTATAMGIVITSGWIGLMVSSPIIGGVAKSSGLQTALLLLPAFSVAMVLVNIVMRPMVKKA